MIVWDSREAEERNARGKLMDAERALRGTRRHARVCAALVVGAVIVGIGELVLAAWLRDPLPLLATAVTACAAVFGLVMRRRFIAEFLPRDIERWHQAQDLCDDVFGGER